MDEKDSAVNQKAESTNRVFAEFFNKITDRFVPATSEDDNASSWIRYGVTPLGLFVWCAYAYLYVINDEIARVTENQNDMLFKELPPDWAGSTSVVLWSMAIMLWFLIGKSFKRGQALTFFFYGLIFPTLALQILRFAFPS